jgi:hypothetical protein
MTVLDAPTQDEIWERCARQLVVSTSRMNLEVVAIVEVIVELLVTGAWAGVGIGSPEHFVSWKAGMSKHRARGLVQIARRREEIPACFALFAEGRLSEDTMVRIARRVSTERDVQVAGLAPAMTIPQLSKLLSSLPPLADPDGPPPRERTRSVGLHTHGDGWGELSAQLPPDEWELVKTGLAAARDAVLRDRKDLPVDAEVAPGEARQVDWADAMVRMADEACDALDSEFQRTGRRGERNQVVLHRQVHGDGTLGQGRFHLGEYVSDALARYLSCDAQVVEVTYRGRRLAGINPAERTPNRRLRRYLEQRDGGCAHPLCMQRRWLHAHHLWHWEDGGPTVAWNLLCLCPLHHRAVHHGEITVEGDPEQGTIVFRDQWGQAIGPPPLGPQQVPPPTQPLELTYLPPTGERFETRWFAWN